MQRLGVRGTLPLKEEGKRKDPRHCGGPLLSRRTGYQSVVPTVTRAIRDSKSQATDRRSPPLEAERSAGRSPSKLGETSSDPGSSARLGPANRSVPLREVGARWRRRRFPGDALGSFPLALRRSSSICLTLRSLRAEVPLGPRGAPSFPSSRDQRSPKAPVAGRSRRTARRWCIPWLLGTSRTLWTAWDRVNG